MKKLIFFAVTILTAAGLAHGAADQKVPASPAGPPPKSNSAKPVDTQKVELKNKSSFQVDTNNRDPFWPIGWKPAPKLADAGADHSSGPEIPVSAFVISSITIERGTKFAIVNGKIMQEGQQFGLQQGGQTYQVTLKSIEDGRVIITRRGQEVIVPLRRK